MNKLEIDFVDGMEVKINNKKIIIDIPDNYMEGTKDCKQSLKLKNENDPIWAGFCPRCDYGFNSELINEYEIKYCPSCGQAIDY